MSAGDGSVVSFTSTHSRPSPVWSTRSHSSPPRVDGASQAWKDVGRCLRLVEYRQRIAGAAVVPRQIQPTLVASLFEIEVRPPEAPRERGLSTLAGADDRDRRELAEASPDERSEGATEHA